MTEVKHGAGESGGREVGFAELGEHGGWLDGRQGKGRRRGRKLMGRKEREPTFSVQKERSKTQAVQRKIRGDITEISLTKRERDREGWREESS